jgi:hypothetical protein
VRSLRNSPLSSLMRERLVVVSAITPQAPAAP